ncbi:MAG: hypothetical protein LUQ62_06445, partial [Methanomicrobiales archaeon]|nr:hypothetical protein [Methanomicrobiales archaeon]
MRPWIALGISLVLVMLTCGCAQAPPKETGRPTTTVRSTLLPATGSACEEYTSTARAVFVSRPWQEENDILFTYEDGFDDLSLEYLTVKVNGGTTWRTTEPWGMVGTGKGGKPSKGATFRVRGEG